MSCLSKLTSSFFSLEIFSYGASDGFPSQHGITKDAQVCLFPPHILYKTICHATIAASLSLEEEDGSSGVFLLLYLFTIIIFCGEVFYWANLILIQAVSNRAGCSWSSGSEDRYWHFKNSGIRKVPWGSCWSCARQKQSRQGNISSPGWELFFLVISLLSSPFSLVRVFTNFWAAQWLSF